ncbi:MAG: membrane protein insertion efficiency factor YidD [Deltaproteobacteria bacterium]|nr:membrane protein insertion efficiency factor YidD [Deltaproteobacteria bacterium]
MDLKALALLHRFYKTLISPCFGNTCRFVPNCSDYALAAEVKRQIMGALRHGGYLNS